MKLDSVEYRFGDHAVCDPDPSTQYCDACPMRGGVGTTDEMFILLGDYFIPGGAGDELRALAKMLKS